MQKHLQNCVKMLEEMVGGEWGGKRVSKRRWSFLGGVWYDWHDSDDMMESLVSATVHNYKIVFWVSHAFLHCTIYLKRTSLRFINKYKNLTQKFH